MCGLRLRFAPRPFLDFGGHPTVTPYPLRFSITSAMAPCLPRLALSFIEPCAHPVCCQGGGDNPPCALFSLFAAGPSSVAVAVVCGPPSSRGTYILGDGTAYVQSNLGTGFGSGGQSCAVWPKTARFGAIRAAGRAKSGYLVAAFCISPGETVHQATPPLGVTR